MARYFGMDDDEDLKQQIWLNKGPLSKTRIENFAIAYGFSTSAVKARMNNILACSYTDKHGNMKERHRVTRGKKVTQTFVSNVVNLANSSKTTGIPLDYKLIAKNNRVSEDEVMGLAKDLI